MSQQPVYFLIGPTAVGKTEIALLLASRMNAQIISADSMQVYRGVDILSAKPTHDQLLKVKHYLTDCLNPGQEWNVADFRRQALASIETCLKAHKKPLVVGGSGLYIRTLLQGLFEGPARDESFRTEKLKSDSPEEIEVLRKWLQTVDPTLAQKWGSGDRRRIMRAIEVYEKTGLKLSHLHHARQPLSDRYEVKIIGIQRDRQELYARVERRVDRMFQLGLVHEVETLLRGPISLTLTQCIGLKDIRLFLEGKCSESEARETMKRTTRRFVKKQLTWFRKERGVEWMMLGPDIQDPEGVAEQILLRWGDGGNKWNGP